MSHTISHSGQFWKEKSSKKFAQESAQESGSQNFCVRSFVCFHFSPFSVLLFIFSSSCSLPPVFPSCSILLVFSPFSFNVPLSLLPDRSWLAHRPVCWAPTQSADCTVKVHSFLANWMSIVVHCYNRLIIETPLLERADRPRPFFCRTPAASSLITLNKIDVI